MVNRLSLLKVALITVFAMLALAAAVAFNGAVAEPKEYQKAPPLTIKSDIYGKPIAYEILLNQWDGAIYDRLSYFEVLAKKVEDGELQTVDYNQAITFDFGRQKPDRMNLIADFNTNPVSSYRRPAVSVTLDGMSFTHPPLPSGYPDNDGIRFYVLTCTWGENEAEYVFVVQGEQKQKDKDSVLNLDVSQTVWMEISPEMSNTTYVDDKSVIDQVVSLLAEAGLRPATAEEVTRIKANGPEPAEVTIEGNSYPRSVAIEFVRKTDGGMAEILATVQLRGDAVNINGNYFISDTVTNDFLAILNDIHSQGIGKTSTEILTLEERSNAK